MKKTEIVKLILAFAVVLMIAGIVITIFAQGGSTVGDVGIELVILSFAVVVICEIILWVSGKRK